MDETPDLAGAGAAEPVSPARRPFTLASLGVATGVCVAWYAVAVAGYFMYANGRSATTVASGCTGVDCPSERTALLTLGFFGLLPTAFVSLLVSLVVLVYAARSLRAPVFLGTVSALAGMALGAAGFVTIATYDVNRS